MNKENENHTAEALEPSAQHALEAQPEKTPMKLRAQQQWKNLVDKMDQGRLQSEQAIRQNPWPALSTTLLVGIAAGTLAAVTMNSNRS